MTGKVERFLHQSTKGKWGLKPTDNEGLTFGFEVSLRRAGCDLVRGSHIFSDLRQREEFSVILRPRALRSGECPPDCFHSSCKPPPHGFRRQRPDFNCADRCSWASRSPVEGCVNGRELQDDESCQLLLRLGEWAILHAAFSFPETNRRSCLGHFKRTSADVDTGLDKRLVVSPPGAEMRIVIVVFPHGKLFG